jgi:prevent-host-death family protein
VFVHDTNHKGNIAEAEIATAAVRQGVDVLKPLVEHGRYDLIFDVGPQLLRIQCKWGAYDRQAGLVRVRIGTSRHTPRGYVLGTYSVGEIDALGIYCGDLDESYLVPIEVVAGQRQLHLRLRPARNGQRAGLHFAADHLLSGAIAQLGERSDGIRKVVGSSPTSSTQGLAGDVEVGAHEFRNRFGWHMERTVAGEEFLVTRRGKPCVRLVSAHAQLPIAD